MAPLSTIFTSLLILCVVSQAAGKSFVVTLKRQNVPVYNGDGKQVGVKAAHTGDISIGGPTRQNFTVVFDTGSGFLFIPARNCRETACKGHRRYDDRLSDTGVSLNMNTSTPLHVQRDAVSVSYGSGHVRGPFVEDLVCLGDDVPASPEYNDSVPLNCGRARVITANVLSEEPFAHFMFDGVLGLGLPGIVVHPDFHIFSMLAKARNIPQVFGFYMSRSEGVNSEIMFGDYDESKIETPLTYLPLAQPNRGYWQIQITGLRIGNETLDICREGNCTAIVDTGTSAIGVPSETYERMLMGTARLLTPELIAEHAAAGHQREFYINGEGVDGVDCRYVPGPEIVFSFGEFEVVLDESDYSRPSPSYIDDPFTPGAMQPICRASVLPLDFEDMSTKMFLLGAPMLKKYYALHDIENERIGLAISKHPAPKPQAIHV